ncbi:DUF917 domain-containing protein [Thermococcus paralvinellae]|uniref:DUF917 domain-containing protein n=1 Tax=Thermococcus paralvinellae TaxID=582419 RepID=W0I5D5_9EURY|nr:DUF917 domain-containing protein [Thermococcus paralvinellae]AHF79922.1 Hypothetical protein TES1_0528 [Thermococcus paralvinellae]
MKLREEDLMDILVGATILGCGGGGSLEEGWKLIKRELKKGRKFRLVDVDDVPNDKIVASPYYVGSLGGNSKDNLAVKSFILLEEFIGEKFFGVVSTEMGGHNTAAALTTAAELGLPLIDADMAGRAVPELHHSVYYIRGYNMCPFSVVTAYEDKIIFSRTRDDLHAEKLVRSIVKVTGANVGVTSHPIRGKIFKRTIIRNAISLAMDIGKSVRKAKEEDKNWVLSLLELGGFLLFKGECVYMERREGSGFTIGEFELQVIEFYLKMRT